MIVRLNFNVSRLSSGLSRLLDSVLLNGGNLVLCWFRCRVVLMISLFMYSIDIGSKVWIRCRFRLVLVSVGLVC